MNNRKLIKLPEVKELTTFSSATIYRLIQKGEFPRQRKLAERSVVWLEKEIYEWIEKKIDTKDEGET